MCFEIVLKIQLTFFILMAWLEMSKTPRLFCKRSDGAGHLSRFFAETKLSLTANLHCCKTSFQELTTLTTLATSLQHNMFIMIYPLISFVSFFFIFSIFFAVLRSLHLSRLNLFNYSFLEIKVKWGDIKLNESNKIGRNWVQ